eukprot:355645-Chlamydomonas_euryale.AAC.41
MQDAKSKLSRQLDAAVKQEQELRAQLLSLDSRRVQHERRLGDASAQVGTWDTAASGVLSLPPVSASVGLPNSILHVAALTSERLNHACRVSAHIHCGAQVDALRGELKLLTARHAARDEQLLKHVEVRGPAGMETQVVAVLQECSAVAVVVIVPTM